MKVISPWMTEADGITISGGEPFEQVEALEFLLRALRADYGKEKDVLVYSGKSWEKLCPRVQSWQALADVVISDPFVSSAPQSLAWRGSDNQRMHLLTDLGRSRYKAWVHASREALPKAMDVFFDHGTVWMAGIPDAGSMEAIQTALADSGFSSATSHAASPRSPSHPISA